MVITTKAASWMHLLKLKLLQMPQIRQLRWDSKSSLRWVGWTRLCPYKLSTELNNSSEDMGYHMPIKEFSLNIIQCYFAYRCLKKAVSYNCLYSRLSRSPLWQQAERTNYMKVNKPVSRTWDKAQLQVCSYELLNEYVNLFYFANTTVHPKREETFEPRGGVCMNFHMSCFCRIVKGTTEKE